MKAFELHMSMAEVPLDDELRELGFFGPAPQGAERDGQCAL